MAGPSHQFAYSFHQRAHVELAKQFLLQDDTAGVDERFREAHALVPDDAPNQIARELLERHDSRVNAYIRDL